MLGHDRTVWTMNCISPQSLSGIFTNGSHEYTFKPLNSAEQALHFTVKASNDAHIALTTTPQFKSPVYEIFLGGWENSKSSIGINDIIPERVLVDTPNLLNGTEAKGFWIKWDRCCIGVGRKGEKKAFMVLYEKIFDISFYGLRTWFGASGEWIIETPPAPGWILVGPTSGPIKWVRSSNGQIPPNALPSGFDTNKEQHYVARAEHNGSLIPGKLVPSHGVVYITSGGIENPKENYEVLCNCAGTWVKVNDGEIPLGALSSGHTETGEPLYVGRGRIRGSLIVGKVKPSDGACYIPFDGKEVCLKDYEILLP